MLTFIDDQSLMTEYKEQSNNNNNILTCAVWCITCHTAIYHLRHVINICTHWDWDWVSACLSSSCVCCICVCSEAGMLSVRHTDDQIETPAFLWASLTKLHFDQHNHPLSALALRVHGIIIRISLCCAMFIRRNYWWWGNKKKERLRGNKNKAVC